MPTTNYCFSRTLRTRLGVSMSALVFVGLSVSQSGPADAVDGPRIVGTAGDDSLRGTTAADEIRGLGGDDTIRSGDGADLVRGQGGDDVLILGSGSNQYLGDFGIGGGGSDRIVGGPGNDILDGGSGADTLLGGSGNDRITDGPGDDTAVGGAGDDDVELFFDGSDTARTGSGNDIVRVFADGVPDQADCGSGRDTVALLDERDPLDTFTNCEAIVVQTTN